MINDERMIVAVKRLKKGQEFKNKKELYRFLGFDTNANGGNQAKAQFENLQRFVRLRKQEHSQRLTVVMIYKEPKPKQDRRKEAKASSSKYIPLIEDILCDYFREEKRKTDNFSKKQLWKILGFVNRRYCDNYWNPNDDALKGAVADVYGEDKAETYINDFYAVTYSKIKNIVKSALQSMQNRGLIKYKDDLIVAKELEKSNYRVITRKDEIETINSIEKDVLNGLGCQTLKDILFCKKEERDLKNINEYHSRISDGLKELNISYVFKEYQITCCKKLLERPLHDSLSSNKKLLNAKITDYLTNYFRSEVVKNKYHTEEYFSVVETLISQLILRNGGDLSELEKAV